MRLRAILENIDRHEFFDFYYLLHAVQELRFENHPRAAEMVRGLNYLADRILADHLNQIGEILISRLNGESAQQIAVMRRFGLGVDTDTFEILGANKLSIPQKQRYISEILPIQDLGHYTGDTWRKLGEWYVGISIPTELQQKINLIDQIYAALHHGGYLVDYFDESRWLESALHYRDIANPKQLAQFVSPAVMNLVGRSALVRQANGTITDTQKLKVAFDRLFRATNLDQWQTTLENNVLLVTNPDRTSQIIISDGHAGIKIIIKKSIGRPFSTQIPKPISRFMHLARDILEIAGTSRFHRTQLNDDY